MYLMTYQPTQIESKWRKKWAKKPLSQARDFGKRKKFYGLVEFPYPSGSGLHLGHAFTMTILDILARKKRMEGFNVLYPMGWDAFGLPTENYAIKAGTHPAKVTAGNTTRFRSQMKRLALAYNWDREVNTTDPNYYKWTQWIFVQLFKRGLAYKQKMPVGWCPSCKVVLANEEIVNGKCERCDSQAERRMQSQWLLRITAYADRLADELDLVDYPDHVKAAQRHWIGRTFGVVIDYPLVKKSAKDSPKVKKIACYSTRPDTNFGATFVVIAPEHPLVLKLTVKGRRKEIKNYIRRSQRRSELERTELGKEKTGVFTGSYCLNQLTGKKMPIWVADFVVATAGTGIVVGVPAHDERDFAFAKKYGLEIVPVVRPIRRGSTKRGGSTHGSTPTDGKPITVGVDLCVHPVNWDFDKAPFTDIDRAVVFNSGFLDGLPALEAKKKIISYLVKKGWGKRATNYHLRDWIFSRQHYWGEPIPMIYCENCARKGITWWDTNAGKVFNSPVGGQKFKEIENSKIRKFENSRPPVGGMAGWQPVPEKDLPVKLPKVEKYQPTDTGESPLANIQDWVKTTCPKCGGPARRETDTMPNWAGSSWYFLRYVDPKNNQALADAKKLAYWLPVDLYLGGAEHTTLHLLYSRFWHKFLNDIDAAPGKEPYTVRRQHGVILGEDGRRMSKSRGNVVNPEDVTKKFGADTLRMYLMFMGPYDQTMPWSSRGVEGIWRFLNRVWRLVTDTIPDRKPSRSGIDRLMHQTIKTVSEDIESMKYNTAIAAIMEFVNEIAKAKKLKPVVLETLVLLLAPFAPFIAEELWCEALEKKYSVHQQSWPKYDPKLAKEEETTIIIQVNGKVRGQLELPRVKGTERQSVEQLAKKEVNVARHLADKKIKKVFFVPARLVNFVV